MAPSLPLFFFLGSPERPRSVGRRCGTLPRHHSNLQTRDRCAPLHLYTHTGAGEKSDCSAIISAVVAKAENANHVKGGPHVFFRHKSALGANNILELTHPSCPGKILGPQISAAHNSMRRSTELHFGALGLHHLPPMPKSNAKMLRLQNAAGLLVVSGTGALLYCVHVFLLYTFGVLWHFFETPPAWYFGIFQYLAGGLIKACTIVALVLAITLMTIDFGALARTPSRCFPLPSILEARLGREMEVGDEGSIAAALPRALGELRNVHDDSQRVYCTRCLLWRARGGHHCSVCQRCVEQFDHHCFVLGCCVHGHGCEGNNVLFISLIGCAAIAGFGSLLPVLAVGAYYLRASMLAMAVLAALAATMLYYAGKAAMWFFYGRHEHLREGFKMSRD